MSDKPNFQTEPEAPTVSFVNRNFNKIAGDTSGKTGEYEEWVKDTEERQARGAAQEAKRRQLTEQASKPIDVVAELDSALTALEAGAVDFEKTHLQPNFELIESRKLVAELTARLAEEQAKLSAIEARGDSVTRLVQSVMLAEGALNGLLRAAEEKAIRKLVTAKFGWEAPMHKIQRETLRELALDISVQSLRQFAIQQHREKTNDVTVLQQRMDAVGRQLAALREHIEKDQRGSLIPDIKHRNF